MNLKSILSECWTGYKQVGMKNKGGRQVPNCVPESVTESSKDDIIKDLDKAKNDLLKKVDALIAKKKKLYSDVDIESPMTSDEKKLDKDIADLFSDINKLVLQKRSLKESVINEETYKVAGRPVTLIKGKKSNGTDWKVKFENGKETSLIDVIALIKPFPKDIKITESELKGYLAADVVDDIVKSIGSKMVKGYVENAPNRNYIYLKLTDIKFGNDVVKMLKSKFGIDAKIDKTFGNIPTVSFPSNKVIKEAQAVSGGKVHKLITGKNLKFKGKLYNQIDFETLGVDNKNGTIRLKIIAPKEIFGNEMSLDFRTVRRGPFFKTDTSNQLSEGLYYVGYNKGRGMGRGVFKDSYSSYKDAKKEVEKIEKQRGGSYYQIAYYVADKDGNFVRESVNEGRSIKSIQTDLDKILNNIQSALAQYKAHKGTDSEKKHIENLKKLNTLKKKYEAELDSAVGGLYRDAELKIEEGTITEKQFKGLEGIPSTKSLEKISKDQKLKIIKAPGNIIDFIVPNGVNRNFWQVIGTGKIQKNSGGNYVLLGKVIHSPAFKSMDDLIDGVNWKSMEERRRFNEGLSEEKNLNGKM